MVVNRVYLKLAVRQWVLEDLAVEVRALGRHLEKEIGRVAQVLRLRRGCVHRFQHGCQSVERAAR